ncbi:MAG: endolytic transglycosylase MltG [Acidobacteriota bacterium]
MRLTTRLLLLVLVLVTAVAIVFSYYHQRAAEPYKGYPGEEAFLTVSPGEPSASIAKALKDDGIIKDERLFLVALRFQGLTAQLQAGEYRFSGPASTLDVIARLVEGDVYYVSVTIPEGLTLIETAELLSERGLGEAKALAQAFSRGELVARLDPEAQDLEGYLYPETYRFRRRPAPDEVARAMVSRFKSVFDASRRQKAEARGMDVREVITLASVVEKETGRPDERPIIASVFWNRLKRRMPLQSDPTVIYELKRKGEFDGNLRRAHLKMESPYNTYLLSGLPPGPIASPGSHSIDAVLFPADTDYLYFVSKNDGSHHFSRTLREHSAAVRKYQLEYFQSRRRSRQRGAGPS